MNDEIKYDGLKTEFSKKKKKIQGESEIKEENLEIPENALSLEEYKQIKNKNKLQTIDKPKNVVINSDLQVKPREVDENLSQKRKIKQPKYKKLNETEDYLNKIIAEKLVIEDNIFEDKPEKTEYKNIQRGRIDYNRNDRDNYYKKQNRNYVQDHQVIYILNRNQNLLEKIFQR